MKAHKSQPAEAMKQVIKLPLIKAVLTTARLIMDSFVKDECKIFIVYGGLGKGKSTFACRVGAQLSGNLKYWDWEGVKKNLVFLPIDFISRTKKLSEDRRREIYVIWDDAGMHLPASENWDPFISSVKDYLNVARTNYAGIIFTCPSPTWVIKKIRNFPDSTTINIIKAASDRRRMARAYSFRMLPDMKKSRVRTAYTDKFWGLMPNSFYWEWYKPLRDSYARYAIEKMQIRLEEKSLRDKLTPLPPLQ